MRGMLTGSLASLLDGSVYKKHKNSLNARDQGERGSVESSKDILDMLGDFIANDTSTVKNEKPRKRKNKFFKFGEAIFYGSNGETVFTDTDDISVMHGVSLNLSNANLIGYKPHIFKPATAKGSGGLVTVFPDRLQTALIFPITELSIKEDGVDGVAKLDEFIGFGKFNRIEMKEINFNSKGVYFKDTMLVNNIKNVPDESLQKVPIGDIAYENGLLINNSITYDAMCSFVNFNPACYEEAIEVPKSDINRYTNTIFNIDFYFTNGTKTKVEKKFFKRIDFGYTNDGATLVKFTTAKNKVIEVSEGVTIDDSGKYIIEELSLDRSMLLVDHSAEYKNVVVSGTQVNCSEVTYTKEGSKEIEKEAVVLKEAENAVSSIFSDATDFATENILTPAKDKIINKILNKDDGDKTDNFWSGVKDSAYEEAEEKGLTKDKIVENFNDFKSMYENDENFFNKENLMKEFNLEVEKGASTDSENNSAEAYLRKELDIPIVPGVSVKIGAGAGAWGKYQLQNNLVKMPDIDFSNKKVSLKNSVTAFGVTLKAEASVYLLLGLALGVPNILTLSSNLRGSLVASAEANLGGSLDFGIRNNSVAIDKISIKGSLNAMLRAVLQGTLALNFFVWNHDLLKCNLVDYNIANITGEIELVKDFANDGKWVVDKSVKGEFLNNAYNMGSDKENLTKMLSSGKKEKVHTFAQTNDDFSKIKEDLLQARSLVEYYNQQENQYGIGVATDEEAPKNLAKLIIDTEDNFYAHGMKAKTQIASFMENIEAINKNKFAIKEKAKKEKYDNYLAKLNEIKTLMDSGDTENKNKAVTQLSEVKISMEKDKTIKTSFNAMLESVASKNVKTKDVLLKYENDRIAQLSKDNTKAKNDAVKTAGKMNLDSNTQSAELLKYYKNSRKDVLSKYLAKYKSNKSDILKFIEENRDAKDIKHLREHKERIEYLRNDFDKLSDSQKNSRNADFYKKYKSFHSPDGIHDEHHEFAGINPFREFFDAEIAKLSSDAKKSLEFSKQKSDYKKLMDMRDSSTSTSEESENARKKLEEIRKKTYKNMDLDRMYQFASRYEIQDARALIAKRDEIMNNANLNKKDTIVNQLKESLLARPDSTERLLNFEKRGNKGKNIEAINMLEQYKKEEETLANNEDGMQNNTAITRYELRSKIINEYFTNHNSKMKVINTEQVGILYDMSELSQIQYDGDMSYADVDNYDMIHKFGSNGNEKNKISDKQKAHDNKNAVSSLIMNKYNTKGIKDSNMLNYYEYNASKSDHNFSIIYEMYKNDADISDILNVLKKSENKKVFDGYKKHLKDFANLYITPNQIIDYEKLRHKNYDNKIFGVSDEVQKGNFTSFYESDLYEKYVKKLLDDDTITISLTEIEKMENADIKQLTSKHTERIMKLENNDNYEYTGNRFKSEKADVGKERERILNDPVAMHSVLQALLEKDSKENTITVDNINNQLKDFENMIATLNKQIDTCKSVTENAKQILSAPHYIFENNEFIDSSIDHITELDYLDSAEDSEYLLMQHLANERSKEKLKEEMGEDYNEVDIDRLLQENDELNIEIDMINFFMRESYTQ